MDAVERDPSSGVPGHPSIEVVLRQAGAVALVDRNGRSGYVNDEACRLAGYGRDELLQLALCALFPDFRRAHWGAIWRAIRTGHPRLLKTGLRTKQGEVVPVAVDAKRFDFDGDSFVLCQVRELRGSAQTEIESIGGDRTAEVKTDAALSEWERSNRSLAENLPDNVVRYDPYGRIVYANRTLCATLGRSREQLLGRGLDEMPEAWGPQFKPLITRGTATQAPEEIKISFRDRFGEKRIHLVRFVTERDEQGAIAGTLAIGRDVTEMERTAALLKARSDFFRAVLENSPDPVARYDRQGRRIYVNTVMARLLGRSSGEVLGTHISDTPMPDTSGYFPLIHQALEMAEESCTDLRLQTAAGEPRWVHLRVVPEFGPDGQVESVLAVGRDVTGVRQTEVRLAEARAELRELAARRETAREDERKRFARELHDELGQVLMALRLEITIAERQAGAGAHRLEQRFARMLGLVDGTTRVIRDLISALRPAALDEGLVPALKWLAADFKRRTGIRCLLEITAPGCRFRDQRSVALFRIVQESLTNVARHAAASQVTIALEACDDGHRLTVRDDGAGFDPSLPHHDSFGLTGIRERALALGGSVSVRSAPGAGTEIEVRVPVSLEA